MRLHEISQEQQTHREMKSKSAKIKSQYKGSRNRKVHSHSSYNFRRYSMAPYDKQLLCPKVNSTKVEKTLF